MQHAHHKIIAMNLHMMLPAYALMRALLSQQPLALVRCCASGQASPLASAASFSAFSTIRVHHTCEAIAAPCFAASCLALGGLQCVTSTLNLSSWLDCKLGALNKAPRLVCMHTQPAAHRWPNGTEGQREAQMPKGPEIGLVNQGFITALKLGHCTWHEW